jgi:hypothetical protein
MNWLKAQRTTIFIAACLAAVLVSLAYLAMPQGHIPPFDANRWRLAETHLEGYCAGVVFVQSQSPERNPAAAEACREENSARVNEVDIRAAVPAFCEPIAEAYGMTVPECEGVVAANRIWPLYDGGFTMTWNDTFPYPGDRILTPPAGSGRVEGRDELEREEQDR